PLVRQLTHLRQEERKLRSVRMADGEEAELDTAVHRREQPLAVLEVEQGHQTLRLYHVAKEPLRRIIGGDARGEHQAGAAGWRSQAIGRLCKEGVGIYVANAGQRVPSIRVAENTGCFGRLLRVHEVIEEPPLR